MVGKLYLSNKAIYLYNKIVVVVVFKKHRRWGHLEDLKI